MGRRASGGRWGSISGVGSGRGWPEKGAPRRAELGSHGNGGWGALGARRGPAWAFIGAWVSLGAGFLRLGGKAGLGECRTGAARTGGSGGRPWRRGNTGRVGARGDLRERQGSLVSAIQGALEGGLGRAATRGVARWLRRRTALPVGRAQGGERLKKRSVANFVIRPKFQNPVL